MLPYFWYILKVIICSGILFGYYWLFLRNKVFHQYNRFYLLTALTLSLVLPLLKINFWQPDESQSDMLRALQAVSVGDDYMNNIIVTADQGTWSIQHLYPLVYWLVSFIFLLVLLQTIFIIRSLLKKYPVQLIDNISFINTNDKSTPFSFLKYIFWNDGIDLDTATGKQIFKHEVAHIQEKHTYDKLFINILLIFFWCNPFFWLYRKELNMIHEFIADKKAVEDSDTASFAAMILQAAYPQQRFQLTNNFFYSPIKRRLLMLTKNNNPGVNYLGRVMALPLAVLIFAAFSFKIKDSRKEDESISVIHANAIEGLGLQNDTIPFTTFVNTKHANADYLKSDECKTKALVIVDSKEIGNLGSDYMDNGSKKYSSVVIYGPAEAKKLYGEKGSHGVIKLTQKDIVVVSADSVFYDNKNQSIKLSGTNTTLAGDLSNTLIYVDQKIISPEELNAIPPSRISSINIIKGDKLDDIVEARGKTAVMYISLKPDDLEEVVVTGKLLKKEPTLAELKENSKLDSSHILKFYYQQKLLEEQKNLARLDQTQSQTHALTAASDAEKTLKEKKIQDQQLQLLKQKIQVEEQNKTNLALHEKQLELKTTDLAVEKTVMEKKLTDQELYNLKQKIQLTEQDKAKQQSEEKLLLQKVQLDANQKDLAEIEVEGKPGNIIFTKTELSPSFTGGEEAWRNFLRANLNSSTPVDNRAPAGKYTVVLKFIVKADGSISDVTCETDPGFGTCAEALRVIKLTPKWQPAIQNGKKVNAYKRQPITWLVQE